MSNISGAKIRALRKRKGLKQVDLEAALSVDYGLDIHQTELSKIERNQRGIRDYELLAIAEILEVEVDILLDRDQAQFKPEG